MLNTKGDIFSLPGVQATDELTKPIRWGSLLPNGIVIVNSDLGQHELNIKEYIQHEGIAPYDDETTFREQTLLFNYWSDLAHVQSDVNFSGLTEAQIVWVSRNREVLTESQLLQIVALLFDGELLLVH